MKRLILMLAIVTMIVATSCGKKDIVTPVDGTNYSIVQSAETGLKGLLKGDELVLDVSYPDIIPDHGLFILDQGPGGAKTLFDPETMTMPIGGEIITYNDAGFFEAKTDVSSKWGVYVPTTGFTLNDLQSLANNMNHFVAKRADCIGCYTMAGDTIFAPAEVDKMFLLPTVDEQPQQALIQQKGRFFTIIKGKKGMFQVSKKALRRYKAMDGWSDDADVGILRKKAG